MKYKVYVSKHAEKNIIKMPKLIKRYMKQLIDDLEEKGPVQKEWKNYCKLSKNEYHCHLSYHWVTCWKNEKNSIIIEVYYAGSREDAPY